MREFSSTSCNTCGCGSDASLTEVNAEDWSGLIRGPYSEGGASSPSSIVAPPRESIELNSQRVSYPNSIESGTDNFFHLANHPGVPRVSSPFHAAPHRFPRITAHARRDHHAQRPPNRNPRERSGSVDRTAPELHPRRPHPASSCSRPQPDAPSPRPHPNPAPPQAPCRARVAPCIRPPLSQATTSRFLFYALLVPSPHRRNVTAPQPYPLASSQELVVRLGRCGCDLAIDLPVRELSRRFRRAA